MAHGLVNLHNNRLERNRERITVLLAEIHGKTVQVARDNEDYVTSAVFGHLRYVPPQIFWDALFGRANGLPGSDGREPTLGRVLAGRGYSPTRYATVRAQFWQRYPKLGEPDVLLVFAGGELVEDAAGRGPRT